MLLIPLMMANPNANALKAIKSKCLIIELFYKCKIEGEYYVKRK